MMRSLAHLLQPSLSNTNIVTPSEALHNSDRYQSLLHAQPGITIFSLEEFQESQSSKYSAYLPIDNFYNRSTIIVIDGHINAPMVVSSALISQLSTELLIIIVKENAHVSLLYDTIQSSYGDAHYSHIHCIVHADAHLTYHGLYAQSPWFKQKITIDIIGSRSTVDICGLVIGANANNYQIETKQNHHAADATSSVLIKTILYDESKFLYSGMINVDENATQTKASQYNKNILCSPSAYAWSVPGLQVHTNNVRCNHGSATGPFDEEVVWYAASRGLSQEIIKRLLLQSFMSDVVASEHQNMVQQLLATHTI